MASVHLCGLGEARPEAREFLAFFRERAARSVRHRLADQPGDADLILVVHGADLRQPLRAEEEALLRERSGDCFAFDAGDRPVGFLPGLYAALPGPHDRGRFRAYCYPAENRQVEEAYRDAGAGSPRQLFFSFLGGPSCRLRRRLCRLGFGRDDAVVEEAVHQEWNPHQPGWDDRKRRYAGMLAASQFALCPRGAGTGSIRLFEAMQAGTVPVVFSDRYVFPDGPDWESFSIRLPERAVARDLPERLAPYRDRAGEMGRRARAAWEAWFAPEVWLDRIVEGAESIRASRTRPEAGVRRLWPWWKLTRQVREEAFNAIRMAKNRLLPR